MGGHGGLLKEDKELEKGGKPWRNIAVSTYLFG